MREIGEAPARGACEAPGESHCRGDRGGALAPHPDAVDGCGKQRRGDRGGTLACHPDAVDGCG